ncbi:LLM class flavin-dependent oxidoreductase [Nonomuraea sp. C10]|uniref:LLM class flavin-dependent oxidoreductase n=1 Tax=Nonomuraea sp. C10 TaxID=2600577 RepID=UPI0021C49DF2|nr:LLM class flavin-dependent oxidoreductase [Nonomuraea sp. C10]
MTDAVVDDRVRGLYADPGKIHQVDHTGEHFAVRGPLNAARPPQGHPLLVQAGSSEDGKEFAARHAEAVFTAQQTLEEARAFYADVKGGLARHGRRPDELLVLPEISPITGSTEREALRLEKELEDLVIPAYGLTQLSPMTGIDLTEDDLDGPLPDVPAGTEGARSRRRLVVDLARRERLTVRGLLLRRPRGAGAAVQRAVPARVRGTHAARALRPRPARLPLHGRAGGARMTCGRRF